MRSTSARVGLISDTHGVLDSRVHAAFEAVDAILHAGDVCADEVLYELQAITPHVVAVRGNCDWGDGGWRLEHVARATIEGVRFLVIHDLSDLGEIPDDVDIVVHGHSHRPGIVLHGRVLAVNPGSASQRRRMPSRSVAIIEIADDGSFEAHAVMLDELAGPTS